MDKTWRRERIDVDLNSNPNIYIRHQGTIIWYCERFMFYGKRKLFPICLATMSQARHNNLHLDAKI